MGEERRIADLTEISAFRANDYIAVDNASEAQTKKLPATAITGPITDAQTDATRALNIARSTSSFPTGDAYSSSSAYKVGDMVIYNNTLYKCKTACSAASWSVNANNFEATSLTSALTDVNNDLSNKQNKSWVEGWDTTKQEHYILVITSGGGNVGFYIPQIVVTDTPTFYQGGSYGGNPYGVGVTIKVSNAAVVIVTAKVNGGDVASTLKIYSR